MSSPAVSGSAAPTGAPGIRVVALGLVLIVVAFAVGFAVRRASGSGQGPNSGLAIKRVTLPSGAPAAPSFAPPAALPTLRHPVVVAPPAAPSSAPVVSPVSPAPPAASGTGGGGGGGGHGGTIVVG